MPGTTEPPNPDTEPKPLDTEPTNRATDPTDRHAQPTDTTIDVTHPDTAPTRRGPAPGDPDAAPRDGDRAPGEPAAVPRGHGGAPGEEAAAPGGWAAEPAGRDPSLERLVLFSDAVFAIAITLLALDLRLPEASPSLGGAELMAAVLATWPHVVSYAITFAVIGAIWIGHLRLLQAIVRCDTVLLGLNLLLLGTVGLLPFHTALLGGHFGDPAAALFYSLGLVLVRLAAGSLWWYAAAGRRLLEPTLSPAAVRGLSQRVLLGLGLSLLGAVAALLDPTVPKVLWLLAGAVPLIRRRTHRPRRAGYTTRP